MSEGRENGWVPVPDPTELTQEAFNRATAQGRRELLAVRELLESELRALRVLLDERYATQTKALDAAFVAAEKAVATALTSAEKAVATAERANEKRFESVNEFRQALTDQAANFMPRTEYSTAHKALEDKVAANAERVATLELRLTSRLDTGAGGTAAVTAERAEQRDSMNTRLVILGVVVSVVVIVVNIAITLIVHH